MPKDESEKSDFSDVTVGQMVEVLKNVPGGIMQIGPYVVKYIGEYPYADVPQPVGEEEEEQHDAD
jgi:hypothetical protein